MNEQAEGTRLIIIDKVLPDGATISDCDIQNNQYIDYVIPLKVHVALGDGQYLTLDVMPTDDAGKVKEMIRNWIGEEQQHPLQPPEAEVGGGDFSLVFKGRVLDESMPVGCYKVVNGSILELGPPDDEERTPEPQTFIQAALVN